LFALRVLCEEQWEEAIAKLVSTESEIEKFKDPAFWERWLTENREFMNLDDSPEVQTSLEGVIAQAAEDGHAMKQWQELASDELKETLRAAQGLAELLELIRVTDFKAVIAVLDAAAKEHCAQAEECRENSRAIPALKEGQESMATIFMFEAEFCELFSRVLSFEFKR
jgi:hypothetical protein